MATKQNIATLQVIATSVAFSSVAFSPDGTQLASGTLDGTVELWDVATKQNIATLQGHTYWVWSVAFSPDGKTLASGALGEAATTKLWNVATRENIATLQAPGVSVAFSLDGTLLASASDEVGLWDAGTGENIAILQGHTGLVFSVSFSPDGKTLASGSGDDTVKLWDVSEWMGSRPHTLVKISGDGQQGISGSALANPLVVEVRDQYDNLLPDVQVTFKVTAGEGRLSEQFTIEHATTDANGRAELTLTLGPNLGTNTVGVSLGGHDLVAFNAVGTGTPATPRLDGDYWTWYLPDSAIARLGKGRIETVAFLPDGQRLIVASSIGVWLYDVATSRELALLPTESRVGAFSPHGTILAVLLADTVKLWDVTTGTNIATLQGHTDWVNSVSFSPDGTTLASGSFDNKVKLWDVATGTNIATLQGHTSYVNSVSFSPDGTTLASGSGDDTVKLWDVATGTNIATLQGHTSYVNSVSFSPDGTTLASGSGDDTVKLWDVATKQNIATLQGHTVNSVSFSPDGTTLASGWHGQVVGCGDNTVKFTRWDVATGTNIATLQGYTNRVLSVSFSPSGAWDGTVKDMVPKQNIATLQGHTVNSVSFSPDGTTLASGSSDGTSILWDMSPYITPITPPESLTGDVNQDGVVNILDLVLVASNLGQTGQNAGDVNGDGVVNILDLVKVAGALGNAAAAPSLYPQALEMFTAADVRQWLTQAQHLKLTDATSQRGIRFLEQLLAALTPKKTALLPNYPNPFNPETWIPYRLAEDALVTLTIYNGSGRVVRTLDVGHRTAAFYESRSKAIHWDGRNEVGEGVASGVYFYHLSAGDYSATRKMLILK